MFFLYSARSPHRTAKPSRGCLPLAHPRALPAVIISDRRSPSAMCEFPFECWGCRQTEILRGLTVVRVILPVLTAVEGGGGPVGELPLAVITYQACCRGLPATHLILYGRVDGTPLRRRPARQESEFDLIAFMHLYLCVTPTGPFTQMRTKPMCQDAQDISRHAIPRTHRSCQRPHCSTLMRPLGLAGQRGRQWQWRFGLTWLESAFCRTGAFQHRAVAGRDGRERRTGGAGPPVAVVWRIPQGRWHRPCAPGLVARARACHAKSGVVKWRSHLALRTKFSHRRRYAFHRCSAFS